MKPDEYNPDETSESIAPVVVTLASVPGATVRYTIDGTEPDSLSDRYKEPILISSASVVIRVIACEH